MESENTEVLEMTNEQYLDLLRQELELAKLSPSIKEYIAILETRITKLENKKG